MIPTLDRPTTHERLLRLLPLAGVCYGVLLVAGDLTIDRFPEGNSRPAELVAWYAAHHGHLAAGGLLLGLSAISLCLFVAGIAARAWGAPAVAALLAVCGSAAAVSELQSASGYVFLARISAETNLDPTALQALHQQSSEGGFMGATIAFLVAVLVAAVAIRTIPVWLGVAGAVIAVGLLTPAFFLASLVFALWCVVTGIMLATRTMAPLVVSASLA